MTENNIISNSGSKEKLHPQKFLMWVAIGSICMMFAGLTSAYVVKKSQDNVISVLLPNIFIWSTIVILASSYTIQLAIKSLKNGKTNQYNNFLALTVLLGIVFTVMQYFGFISLVDSGVKFIGRNSNPGASFLLVIIGLHALHIIGGVIALLIFHIKSSLNKTVSKSVTGIEVLATYWHFVDILWVYLLIFLIFMR